MRAIIFMIIGAAAMYLYLNPGDMAGLIDMSKGAVHDTAKTITEATK
jgi:hypothetical protein|tara:strand:- start:417 stop:557 length:141 start_codon:yes stop_codon:yes gene_type:complete